MLSLGAKARLSPKLHREAVGGEPGDMNALTLGPLLFHNRLEARRRIHCVLKLPTRIRSVKKV